MNFGDLLDATALAARDTPVRVRTAAGECDLVGVEIPLTDLDAHKHFGDQPEGSSRAAITVYLSCGEIPA